MPPRDSSGRYHDYDDDDDDDDMPFGRGSFDAFFEYMFRRGGGGSFFMGPDGDIYVNPSFFQRGRSGRSGPSFYRSSRYAWAESEDEENHQSNEELVEELEEEFDENYPEVELEGSLEDPSLIEFALAKYPDKYSLHRAVREVHPQLPHSRRLHPAWCKLSIQIAEEYGCKLGRTFKSSLLSEFWKLFTLKELADKSPPTWKIKKGKGRRRISKEAQAGAKKMYTCRLKILQVSERHGRARALGSRILEY